MKLRTSWVVSLVGLLLPWGAFRAYAEPDLVNRSKAVLADTEAAIEVKRKARLEDRTAYTRRLQAAYARLEEARASAELAEVELRTRQKTRAEKRPSARQAERNEQKLRRILGQAGDVPPSSRSEGAPALVAKIKERVKERLRRLEHDTHLHPSRGPVLDRAGRRSEAQIYRFGRVQALAVGAGAQTAGFLSEPSDGPPHVVGPRLSPEAEDALRAAKPGVSGQLPLDLDGALTRVTAEPPQEDQGIRAGGAFIWPILAVGLLGLVLLAERFVYLVLRPAPKGHIRRVVEALRGGDLTEARRLVKSPKTDLERVLAAGVNAFEAPRTVREQALETALLREESQLERGLSLLGAVAGLAPLLGLLGTVTGMIGTFDVISTFGTGNPRLLSGGISVALITTQLGLVVAVPALLAHAWVTRKVAKRQALLETARTEILSLEDRGAAS